MKPLLLAIPLLVLSCAGETQQAPKPQAPLVAAVPDPHSYSRPGEARVEHIALDLDVDFARKQLDGTAVVRFKNLTGTKTLVLDTNGLDVRRVTRRPEGTEAKFTLGIADPVFGRPLEIEIGEGTTEVAIEYSSSPDARALQWLEPPMTAGKKRPFLLSQSQAILARSWVPLQDTPQVRFTYDATLRVPKDLLALMSAENPQSKSADGVYRFRMPQPIPSYLLAIAVGDLEFRALDARSGVYAEPEVIARAASEFADTPKMIDTAEALYGPYRWGRYDLLVLPPSFPYGGMENPRLSFITPTVIAGDRSLVSLIAHELAHSWSGNLVTNATWSDFWLNEGFTAYIENRIIEKLYGRDQAEMNWALGRADLERGLSEIPPADQGLFVDLAGRDPDDGPLTVYEKGALFLRLLEETAGRERWDAFLRAYFDRFAFQPMTTTGFIAHLTASLPDVVQKVNVGQWVSGPGIPASAPKPSSEAFRKVEAHAKAFAAGAPADTLPVDGWSTQERVHFIKSLPNLYPERMESLDLRFHFRESGNSEVLSAWLEKSLDTGYKDVYPAVERFLTVQGRRKFLRPLYEKLFKSDPDFARRIYAKARPTYHPVSQATVDGIVGKH